MVTSPYLEALWSGDFDEALRLRNLRIPASVNPILAFGEDERPNIVVPILLYPATDANIQDRSGKIETVVRSGQDDDRYVFEGNWFLNAEEKSSLESRIKRALDETGAPSMPLQVWNDFGTGSGLNIPLDTWRNNWGDAMGLMKKNIGLRDLGMESPEIGSGIASGLGWVVKGTTEPWWDDPVRISGGAFNRGTGYVPLFIVRGLGNTAAGTADAQVPSGGFPTGSFEMGMWPGGDAIVSDAVIEPLAGRTGSTAFETYLKEVDGKSESEAKYAASWQVQMGTVLHESMHMLAHLPHVQDEQDILNYENMWGGEHGDVFRTALERSIIGTQPQDHMAALNYVMGEYPQWAWGLPPGEAQQVLQETTMAGENEIPLEAFSADNVDAQGTALAGSRDPDANPNDIKANFLNTYMGISTGVKVPTDLRAAFDESAGTWRIWIKPGIREGEFESPSEAEAQATKETERTGVVHTVKRSTTTGGYQVVEVEPSTQRGYATEELALAQAQPDQEAYELGGNQGWALRRKFEPDQKINPDQPFFLDPQTEEAHFIDLGGGKKMFFLTDGSTVTAQGAVDWTNAKVQTVAEGTAQEQKFVVWPDGTKSPLGDKFTGGVPPAEIALQSQIMLADGTFAAVLNNGQVFRTGREIKPAEVKPDPITGKIQVTQPDGSISFIDPAYPVQLDQVGGYNLLQQRSGAIADIGLPEVPASIEEMQGQQFIRGTRGELVPLNDVLDRTIEMALINGDVDKAIAFDDFRKRPSRAEALQMALEFARSPADQVLISAISSGETHIAPPSPGELQRVGPQAQFLQQAYQEFRDTLTGGRLPTTAEFQEAMAPPPPPPPTDMEIAQLEHQQLVNQQLTQKIEFDKGKAQREIDAFNLRMSQDAAKHIAEMTKINKEEEIAVREANQKISESLANTDVTQYSGEQITMPAPIPPAPMPDEDEDEEWNEQLTAMRSQELEDDRTARAMDEFNMLEDEARALAAATPSGVSFTQHAARSFQEELEGAEGNPYRESLEHIAKGSGGAEGFLSNIASFREELKDNPTAEIASAASSGDIRYRAGGGRVGNKEVTVVGEQGPEIAMFPVGTEIIPMGQPTAGQMDMARRTGRAYANGGEIGGIVFDRYGGEIPSGARRTMAGQPIAPSAGRVFTAAGLGVPSGQSLRNMLPEDLDVYRDLGAQAGIPEGTFERELMLGTPSGERQRGSARFLPLSLRS